MYQHQACLGFDPARVVVRTDIALPIKKGVSAKLMVQSIDVDTYELEQAREELQNYTEPLCKKMKDTNLHPFRAINYSISLINENKWYPWRASRWLKPF